MATAMGTLDAALEQALTKLRARTAEMHAMTRSWVEVNSFTANVEGVNRVGALLRDAFALPSLALTTISGGSEYGEHLVWRTPAPGAPILLIGHHDTVFPPGHF